MIRMTSQVIVWLVVVVSLCMHACSARYLLSLIHDHTESAGSKQQLQYPPKVQKVMEDVSLATQGGDQTWVGAVIITAIKKHTLVFKQQSSTAAAGEARLIAHTRDGLQQQEGRNDNLVKGIMRKRRGRALTMAEMNEKMEEKEGSSNSHHHDEAAEETTSSTDVVVMDYAQPHRKPPIHNEKA